MSKTQTHTTAPRAALRPGGGLGALLDRSFGVVSLRLPLPFRFIPPPGHRVRSVRTVLSAALRSPPGTAPAARDPVPP
ncbi:hypothetical protein GCM10026982_53900 [Nocardiopsis aegyptia]